MRLYGYWRSSCTYRVRIALGLKGIDYEVVPVNLLEGKHRSEAHLTMNPVGQVPVLEVGDAQLTQSVAILEYLEETHPEPALLPSSPLTRARVRQLTELINSGIQPLQNFFVMQRLKNEHGVDAKAWSAFHIRRGLLAYERAIDGWDYPFSVSDEPTFAECALIPQLYNARRFGIDVEAELPRLARIDTRCAEIEAFAAAHPDRQPDAPTE